MKVGDFMKARISCNCARQGDGLIPAALILSLLEWQIELKVPGGGKAEDAKRQLAENENAYPEFSMFGKTMPASGIYIRHVRGLKLQDVKTTPEKEDARPVEDIERFMDVSNLRRGCKHVAHPRRPRTVGPGHQNGPLQIRGQGDFSRLKTEESIW